MEPLLRAHEVAELLGISPETVLRWTRRGELPAIRLPGGAVRYRPDEFRAWLESRSAVGNGPDARGEVSPTPSALPARGVVSPVSPTPIGGEHV